MLNRRCFLRYSGFLAGPIFSVASEERSNRARRLHIGAQTNTWGAPIKSYDHLLEILEILHQLGYQGFETNYRSLNSQANQAAQCRRAFESRRIQFVAPHTSVKLWDRQNAGAEIEEIRRLARYSADMGASHLIASGRRLPHPNGRLDPDQVHAVTEALNRVGRACRQEGLKFCYHNHIQEFEDEPSEMSFILSETDPEVVWLNYDVGNAYPAGPKPGTFSAAHFKRIAIYHIKDVKQEPGGKAIPVDLGTGNIDLKAVLAPLFNSDWQGWLMVEREGSYPNPAANPEALLRQCRAYLKQATGV